MNDSNDVSWRNHDGRVPREYLDHANLENLDLTVRNAYSNHTDMIADSQSVYLLPEVPARRTEDHTLLEKILIAENVDSHLL